MNINASIVDQRLGAIVENIRDRVIEELSIRDENKLKSVAFAYFCISTILNLNSEEVFDSLTEGSGDFGVDALHISPESDSEFTVTLVQAKYKNDLEGNANFPEQGINSLINAIQYLFDPRAELTHINFRLLTKVEEVRSLIKDGYIPQVRVLACNNGLTWNKSAQEAIDRANFGDQVTWEHVNHDRLVKIIQAPKQIDETLYLSGKAIVEDMEFSRVLIGKIAVTEVAKPIDRYGERLLERNIRRYLGLKGNRVNADIYQTLRSLERNNFYYYNNGITLICDSFSYNALQSSDYQVRVENLQIVNGGQTCLTIYKTLQNPSLFNDYAQVYVLIRLYQLAKDNRDLVQKITYATNSQNPVELRDLRSNDEIQKRLELDIQQLGFNYIRKRSNESLKPKDITVDGAAEAILAVWLRKPHQAKFFSREHFGKLYKNIFTTDLNGAQVITAFSLGKVAGNLRNHPSQNIPRFVRYGFCYIAMQMGQKLLRDMGIGYKNISHRNFKQAMDLIKHKGRDYLNESIEDIEKALRNLYGQEVKSLQQLSATFRRGDLIDILSVMTPLE